MDGTRNSFVAREGIPFLLSAVFALLLAVHYRQVVGGLAAAALLVALFLAFRDPRRDVPASPLGIVSPVDGKVVEVTLTDKHVLQGEAHIIRIRIDSLGTYTARSPVEGKVMDLGSAPGNRVADYRTNALWLQTDEAQDVVLQFHGYRLGLAPQSFMRLGERVGQGQRCAYLRLTRVAELHIPISSKVLVEAGQTVVAGADLIGKLPHS